MDNEISTSEAIKKIRESTGMSRKDFCEHLGIPYRTVTEWERDGRHCPEYVVRLLSCYVTMKMNSDENSPMQ